jgi:hypothetical protein
MSARHFTARDALNLLALIELQRNAAEITALSRCLAEITGTLSVQHAQVVRRAK